MMSFRDNRLAEMALPTATAWLLADIAEAKALETLYTRQSPHVLRALRETAIIQSAESSNRIEGVTVDPKRLRPLVLGNAKPKDRSEAEVQGYRGALNLIHSEVRKLAIAPSLMRRLHETIQPGSGDAGQFKRIDNEIIERREGGEPVVRFRPVSARQTPAAVDELCLAYRHCSEQRMTHPLLGTGAMVLDFLCIHPFRDGNGRVSRLLTLLGLYRAGFGVGRYISIERLIEDDREGYYDALAASSAGWHQNRHDLLPWLNHFLAIVRRAYVEFAARAGDVKAPRGAKTDLVVRAIDGQLGSFSAADLQQACPGVSPDMIRRVLKDLQADGKVECLRRGRGAQWRKLGNNSIIG